MKDAIVEEMRETRRQIEEEFDRDVDEYLHHVYEVQRQHGDKLVRRQPKLLKQHKIV
jgi:hypothetical protein